MGPSPILHQSLSGTTAVETNPESDRIDNTHLQGPTVQPNKAEEWVPHINTQKHHLLPKTLVICFDGTGDQFDDDNSNVVKFLAALKKDDDYVQRVYYQAGIGTYTNSSIVTPALSQIAKKMNALFAWNLGYHIMEGYQFLMQNYSSGDKICIFGFSRGAYCARGLAGMLHKVGLLPANNTQQIPFAWAMYVRKDAAGWRNSADFKKTFSIDVKIEFVGVWDTVASVGLIPQELPFIKDNTAISYFRHAVSLDEHRAKFIPTFYTPQDDSPAASGDTSIVEEPVGTGESCGLSHSHEEVSNRSSNLPSQTGDRKSTRPEKPVKSMEVWFAGCHCDVGGGSVKNRTLYNLARIPLRWMIRECFKCNTGIIFNSEYLKNEIGLSLDKERNVADLLNRYRDHSFEIRHDGATWSNSLIWDIFRMVGTVVSITLEYTMAIIFSPVYETWLHVKYTTLGYRLRRKFAWINRRIPSLKLPDAGLRGALNGGITGSGDAHDSASSQTREPSELEEEEDLRDIKSPEYDQLQIRWVWWLVELIPLRFRNRWGPPNEEEFVVSSNLGKGRHIHHTSPKIHVHYTVKIRMKDPKYAPRAQFINKKNELVTGRQWNEPASTDLDLVWVA